MNQLDLNGRTAIVTGGARGIGEAIARRLSASGATVALWDFNYSAAVQAAAAIGAHCHAIEVDVADTASVTAATAATAGLFDDRIDILVNNAAISGVNASVCDYSLDEWQRIFSINVTGLFLCCSAIIPFMQKNNYGRVVNFGSVAGKEGNPGAGPYSASKAAVICLTKSLGKELARTNVRVNCIAPGATKTPMFEQMSQEHIDYMLSKSPLGRFGRPDEIASMVAWMCSDECSFTTGAVFDASGGRATY